MLSLRSLLCLASRPAASSPALRQAVHLATVGQGARHSGATLHVVLRAGEDASAVEEAVRRQRAPDDDPIDLQTTVFENDAPEEVRRSLRRYAKTIEADLFLFDSSTDRRSGSPLTDEGTTSLICEPSCSVFAVGTEAPPTSMERILLPTDLSDGSVQTLRYVTELAARYDASILLLHVIETSPYVALTAVDRLSLGQTTLTEHRARRRLQEVLEKGRSSDVPIRPRFSFGDPADQITRFVTERNVDLLVLGPHGAGRSSPTTLGTVANRVLRRVACSTLVVRAAGDS